MRSDRIEVSEGYAIHSSICPATVTKDILGNLLGVAVWGCGWLARCVFSYGEMLRIAIDGGG